MTDPWVGIPIRAFAVEAQSAVCDKVILSSCIQTNLDILSAVLFQTSTAAPLFAMCLLIYLDGGPRYLRAGYWYATYTSSRKGKDHIRKHGRQSRCHPELENEDGEDGRPAKTATEAVRRHRRMHVLGRAPTSADPTPFPRRKEEETGGEILPAKNNEPSLGCPLACLTDL